MPLTPESVEYTAKTSLVKRKKLGQYMTPSQISHALMEKLPFFDGAEVLDPAVGTGELLLAAKTLSQKNLTLHGWDIDEEILTYTPKVIPEADLRNHSFLNPTETQWVEHFDFIIANPPYLELKNTEFNRNDFTVASGRTNIFSLFFERALPLLKPGGYMGFIVPPSMNTGAYFSKLRQHLLTHTEIKHIELVRENGHFTDALTSVQLIVLQKTGKQDHTQNPHVVDFTKITGNPKAPVIFTDSKNLIMRTWEGKKSLHDYGYEAVTGPIPWNQYKENLTSEQQPGTYPLLYSKDITSEGSVVHHPAVNSRRYLKASRAPFTEDSIIVNRVVGSLTSPRLKMARISGMEYYAENHLNVIRARADAEQVITLGEVFERLRNFPEMGKYLQAVTGSTQLSATELNWVIPL